jgi:hypothetical protein
MLPEISFNLFHDGSNRATPYRLLVRFQDPIAVGQRGNFHAIISRFMVGKERNLRRRT